MEGNIGEGKSGAYVKEIINKGKVYIKGYDKDRCYNNKGYNREGLKRGGYNEYGWNKEGINEETGTKYDREGYAL